MYSPLTKGSTAQPGRVKNSAKCKTEECKKSEKVAKFKSFKCCFLAFVSTSQTLPAYRRQAIPSAGRLKEGFKSPLGDLGVKI